MNTVKSFWLGWGALCIGGAGAYYFAKKEINASRVAKMEQARKRRLANDSLEYGEDVPSRPLSSSTMAGTPARTDAAGSPSQEAGSDPAPTRHAPETDSQRVLEKSKYEPSIPFTSRKGDRFS